MRLERGKPAAPGFGDGRALIYHAAAPPTARVHIAPTDVGRERDRFTASLARAALRLELLEHSARSELGQAEGEIFAAHLALLKDPQFRDRILRRIGTNLESAEQAISAVVDELAATLASVDDEYLRERGQDIRDLGGWVLRQLALHDDLLLAKIPPRTVLVAHELLPSDLLRVDRSNLSGIVTEAGGEVGHAAILARSLGIPYVTGVNTATERIAQGERVLVDGQTGEVWIDPDAVAIPLFLEQKKHYDQDSGLALSQEGSECATLDGVRVFLHANIGHPGDAADVVRHNLDGVGLFRTEYMFLDAPEPPGLERQQRAYEEIAAQLGGRPVVIRTLDFGGDKWPAFLAPQFERNPRLGLRGLRFSLTHAADLFRTQLRAIARAARAYDIRVLFPMVLGSYDLRKAVALLHEICTEEGVSRRLPCGAMVEAPSSVFMIDEIMDGTDFVSLGTNDLTQFMLAADRNAAHLLEDYSAVHPAMLRAMRAVIQTAVGKRKSVSICGEAAADPATAALLVGLGIRTLSMSPASAARVRQLLRRTTSEELKQLAGSATGLEDPNEVEALLRAFIGTSTRRDDG